MFRKQKAAEILPSCLIALILLLRRDTDSGIFVADQQSSAEHEEFKMKYFWLSVLDWKTWLYAAIYMGCSPSPSPDNILNADPCLPGDAPLYAFSLFLPSIISSLGYTSTKAQLLSVPPYAAAAILTISVGCEFSINSIFVKKTIR